MEAIILAGGFGTRLRTVVSDRPKVLSIVAGRPFLSYVIDHLAANGITHFIFAVGYLSHQVIEFIQSSYSHLSYTVSTEESPLGTGGAIKQALQFSAAPNVFVVNADTYFDVDLPEMHKAHVNKKADCTIALKQMFNFDRYGVVQLNEERRVAAFEEKTFKAEGFINGGVYLLHKKRLNLERFPDVFSFEREFLEKKVKELFIQGFVAGGYFIDIGIPSDYEAAQLTFANFNQQL